MKGTECVMCAAGRRPPRGGVACCNEDTEGREICSQYASNNELFLVDFEEAFYKMIEKTDDILSTPQASTTIAPPGLSNTAFTLTRKRNQI